jgi:hypothetical protein
MLSVGQKPGRSFWQPPRAGGVVKEHDGSADLAEMAAAASHGATRRDCICMSFRCAELPCEANGGRLQEIVQARSLASRHGSRCRSRSSPPLPCRPSDHALSPSAACLPAPSLNAAVARVPIPQYRSKLAVSRSAQRCLPPRPMLSHRRPLARSTRRWPRLRAPCRPTLRPRTRRRSRARRRSGRSLTAQSSSGLLLMAATQLSSWEDPGRPPSRTASSPGLRTKGSRPSCVRLGTGSSGSPPFLPEARVD